MLRPERTRLAWWSVPAAVVLLTGALLAGAAARAEDAPAEIEAAVVQRLHRAGHYLPELEIRIGEDRVATVSGTVESDIVKAEVVETVRLTVGVRDVIDRLEVAR